MKTWDVVIIGGGVIGMSLAVELRRGGAQVLVVDRSEPGREASYASAGMLAPTGNDIVGPMRELARRSFAMWPEFEQLLEDESGGSVDLRTEGTILLSDTPIHVPAPGTQRVSAEELAKREPHVATAFPAFYLPDASVDPRAVMAALAAVAKQFGVEVATGAEVSEVRVDAGRVTGVRTTRTQFAAGGVVNCAGAWAGSFSPVPLPVRPVKGQMVAVIPPVHNMLRHVVSGSEVYMVPRSDGRLLIGATVEEAGFDKQVEPQTIQRLHQQAALLVPGVGEARVHSAWTGLRPGTPDAMPIMGETSVRGYYVSTGHFRNGVLLAPASAAAMAALLQSKVPEIDLAPYSPARFAA